MRAGGTFTRLFLDVGDYHHYHFPLGGVVREVVIIPGQEMAGGYITWDPRNKRYAFFAPDLYLPTPHGGHM